MKVQLITPRGMDIAIKSLQDWLQGFLFPLWGIDANDPDESAQYIFYPRVYRNSGPNNSGFIAEVYTGGGNYSEVYWTDQLKGLSFFGIGPKIITEGNESQIEVHLITFANVKKLYGLVDHRADNEIRQDFERAFVAPIYGFTLLNTEIWLQNVLREYPGSRRESRLDAADMGEVHAFRLNLKLVFNSLQIC